MTNRYTAIDIRKKIIDLLSDNLTGINYYIGLINTERTHACPTAGNIGYLPNFDYDSFVFVDMGDSQVERELLDDDYTKVTENYEVYINCYLKSLDLSIHDFTEDFGEAVIRCVHGYQDNYITWIALLSTERAELYDQQDQTQKLISLKFNVRIN